LSDILTDYNPLWAVKSWYLAQSIHRTRTSLCWWIQFVGTTDRDE